RKRISRPARWQKVMFKAVHPIKGDWEWWLTDPDNHVLRCGLPSQEVLELYQQLTRFLRKLARNLCSLSQLGIWSCRLDSQKGGGMHNGPKPPIQEHVITEVACEEAMILITPTKGGDPSIFGQVALRMAGTFTIYAYSKTDAHGQEW